MSKKGIDVSVWNGNIDWSKAKDKIDFAILRVGYGSNLRNQDDGTFKRNADACVKYGIPFGVYIYSYATNTAMAKSEAEHTLRLIKGYKLSYPVYLDLEDAGTTGKCSKSTILKMSKAFASVIEDAGYTVGFYANTYWWTNKLTDSWYNGYSRWVAQYNSKCTYSGKYDIWQYTSTGKVSGVTGNNGNVDMNICYKDFGKKTEPSSKPSPKPASSTIKAGKKLSLKSVPLYASATSSTKATSVTGTYYLWNTEKVNSRYRITNSTSNVGKSGQVTGWIDSKYVK